MQKQLNLLRVYITTFIKFDIINHIIIKVDLQFIVHQLRKQSEKCKNKRFASTIGICHNDSYKL